MNEETNNVQEVKTEGMMDKVKKLVKSKGFLIGLGTAALAAIGGGLLYASKHKNQDETLAIDCSESDYDYEDVDYEEVGDSEE